MPDVGAKLMPPKGFPMLTPGREFSCSDCHWAYEVPELGSYGHHTSKARLGQVKNAFSHHDCNAWSRLCMTCGKVLRGNQARKYQHCRQCKTSTRGRMSDEQTDRPL